MPKAYLLPVVLVLCCMAARGDTTIPAGPVSGIWTVSGSPYLIEGEVSVPHGETLTLEPGVDVIFEGHYKLLVAGRLLAVGTALDSIRFTARDPSTGWHGIRFVGVSDANDSSLVVYCLLERGRATGEYPDSYGGGLFIDDFEKIRIAHCTFRDNSAAHGGGLACNTGGIIADNRFIGNAAQGAYGYPGAGSALRAGGATVVLRNTVHENWSWNGGPAVTLSGNALLQENRICENDGQGVSCYANYRSRIASNTICGNSGAGICCRSGVNAQIVNCLICDNGDSGLYLSLSFATIVNCTISGNSAQEGGGLFCSLCDPIFINCILWGNTAIQGDQVYLHGYSEPSVNPDFFQCDIEGGVEAFGRYPGVSYEGRYEENIDCDPCFAGGVEHPYTLTAPSYCINAGRLEVAALGLPGVDLAGAPRIYEGFRVDIGAYEHQGPPAFADMPLFTPLPGWYPDPQTVCLDCPTPDVSIHYTRDGSEPSPESPLYVTPLPISAHTTIRARAFHATLPPSLTSSGAFRIGSDLAGPVTGTLPVEHSPYHVVGDLEVPIGETLIVEPGVQFRFMGHHRLDVQGQLLAIGTPADEILLRADQPEVGWAGIRFEETPALNDSSKLEHCVILHGDASGSSPDDCGGGIYVENFSKLLVRGCRLRACSATKGGGMACDHGASPQIRECIFEENSASERGGGLYCGGECAPGIIGNTFWTNRAAQGGGLTAHGCGDMYGPVRIEGNEFFENQATYGSPLIPAGGAMYVYNGGAVICGNLVSGNTSDRYGAGIHVEHLEAEIANNVVTGNIGQGAGGGVACYAYSRGRLVNNLIHGNQAESGGGIFLGHADQWRVVNNTVCDNNASLGGGLLVHRSEVRLVDCILWGSTALDGPQLAISGQCNLEVTFCDLEGGQAAIGGDPFQPYLVYSDNINDDPVFVPSGEWPYALGDTSPCIDAGIPDTTGLGLPPLDLAGYPRIVGDRVDMGAYEYQGTSEAGDGAPTTFAGPVFTLWPLRPNPLRGETQIVFTLATRAHVRLCIHDPSGRRLRTLIDGLQPPGICTAVWEGRNDQGQLCAAGVYFARLTTGQKRACRSLVLLR